jgi:hypothetical protein
MTRKELSQVFYLNKEMKMWEEKLNELRSKSLEGTQKITGMPFANTNDCSDKTFEHISRIMELQSDIEVFRTNIERKVSEIEKYIMTLDDSILRQIIEYRCCQLKSWRDVAAMIGGDNTPDGCRMMFDRQFPREKRK